jgi:hypothetical protein
MSSMPHSRRANASAGHLAGNGRSSAGAGRAKRASGKTSGAFAERSGFVLYVEGPRDQGLLAAWATRLSPRLGVSLEGATVILGGCQPARAAEQFRVLRATDPEARGLCVLDRDADDAPRPPPVSEPGLDFFTWSRRHIESYLLVPGAIRRSLGLPADDARIERFFRSDLPASEEGLGAIDAKSLFAFRGEFQRLLGRPVRPAHVARAMHAGEIHADVLDLLARVRGGLGLGVPRAE